MRRRDNFERINILETFPWLVKLVNQRGFQFWLILLNFVVFCLYLCPVGGFLGTYSMASMTEFRAIDPQVCIKHKDKSCYNGGPGGWACPWNQYVGNMRRNNYCGMCTELIKSCPQDNVGIFFKIVRLRQKIEGR